MEKEVIQNNIVNNTLNTLKSSFLDVYYYYTGSLAYLEKQIESSDNKKEEVLAVISEQKNKLNESLSLVEKLLESIKGIDSESRKLQGQFVKIQDSVVDDKVNDTNLENTEVKTEATKEAIVEANFENPELSTEAVADDVKEAVTEPQISEERRDEIKKEVENSVFTTFRELIGDDKIVKNKDGSIDFNSMIPKEITSKLNGKKSLADIASAYAAYEREITKEAAPIVNDGPVIAVEEPAAPVVEVSTEAVAEVATEAVAEVATEAVAEVATEAVAEVATEAVIKDTSNIEEQVIIPTVAPPAAPAVINKDIVNEEINAALNEVTTEVVVEMTTEPINNPEIVSQEIATEAVVADIGLRRFISSEGQTKAILVSEAQYKKLNESCNTQEALLKFKHILPEDGGAIQTSTGSVLDADGMTDDEKKKTIEAMMAEATELYNSGKVQEAQAMYDKISELNKSLVKS